MAREMGIGKKELLKDYYLDEFIILVKRQAITNKRRDKESKKEETQEVFADEFFK